MKTPWDFQGITYDTPRSGKIFKTAGDISSGGFKSDLVPGKPGLLAQVQPGNQGTVTLNIRLLQVLEHVAAAADHQQQTTMRVVILRMVLQVRVEVIDASGQQRNLHLGRTGVFQQSRSI